MNLDYATSLNNSAIYLSDVGQNDAALAHGREALEIRKRLAQKHPDRFESDYASSLSNYAGDLSDLGQYTESLRNARNALEIRKRLANKQPKRFAGAFFVDVCFVRFLDWLCDEDEIIEGAFEGEWSTMSSDEQGLARLYSEFIEAVTTKENETRRDSFRSVLFIWTDLSVKRKQLGAPYRLCATAWCAKFDSLTESDWQINWWNYLRKRNGHIPSWMLEVARRLEFQFPEQSQP